MKRGSNPFDSYIWEFVAMLVSGYNNLFSLVGGIYPRRLKSTAHNRPFRFLFVCSLISTRTPQPLVETLPNVESALKELRLLKSKAFAATIMLHAV